MGRIGLVTLLPQSTELRPLLCGKQRSSGSHVWSLLLGSRNSVRQHCTCVMVTSHCGLLGQNVDHQGARLTGK